MLGQPCINLITAEDRLRHSFGRLYIHLLAGKIHFYVQAENFNIDQFEV